MLAYSSEEDTVSHDGKGRAVGERGWLVASSFIPRHQSEWEWSLTIKPQGLLSVMYNAHMLGIYMCVPLMFSVAMRIVLTNVTHAGDKGA